MRRLGLRFWKNKITMKKLLFFPFLFVACFCFGQAANAVIGTPIKVGNLLVAQYDFPKEMGSIEAQKMCKKLGNGWRLPSIAELKFLYKSSLKQNTARFDMKRIYWSGTLYTEKMTPSLMTLDFKTGEEDWSDYFDPDDFPITRAVRSASK